MTNKTVIIIGGTFNPITNAHVEMGILAQKRFPEADIFYVPSNLNFISHWKNVNQDKDIWTDYKNRIIPIMGVLSEHNFFCSISEVINMTDGTTYDLVKSFKDFYDNIYLCVGFDKIDEIQHWSHADELMDEVNLILFSRNGQGKKDITNEFMLKYIDIITEIEMPEEYQYMSSTKVREAYYENRLDDVKDMIPENVYEYLKEKINV